ncbi:two-component system, OmpR family, response regulator [Prosthecobacter debontii]|uniref:Two-component system, OmpR family, response regulator n=1 Tax=Prosthecobacter debontii TaxID=48467 RepID=A0A1T4XYY5_9BACT|nr:response regulator transcription factor [Prosthecobacter debontii]SKA94261.1 two-component system, OmpR family, response regulator [Prosthecobacter debontii]
MNLLLVEDDPELARQVRGWMHDAGHELRWESSAAKAMECFLNEECDVVILDVGLPDMNGFSLMEKMRREGVRTPVLFLTARADVADRVRGFAAGADDYLTKPFAHQELLARVEALHRRATNPIPTHRSLGNCRLDLLRHRVSCGGDSVELQPREWALLEVLMNHEGRVLPKKFLLEQVWDIHFDPGTNVVDAMICRLRRKLEAPGCGVQIETIRGKGYVFKTLA